MTRETTFSKTSVSVPSLNSQAQGDRNVLVSLRETFAPVKMRHLSEIDEYYESASLLPYDNSGVEIVGGLLLVSPREFTYDPILIHHALRFDPAVDWGGGFLRGGGSFFRGALRPMPR